jgi:hypothetical protein
MTATWALVFMLCYRSCEPQYSIPYSSRSECVRAIPKDMRMSEKAVCIPISKD